METLGQASGMIAFLFVQDIVVDPDDAEKIMSGEAGQILGAAHEALAEIPEWSTEFIEAALRAALIDGLELKPKVAFGPVRLAITGRRVSPPLFESMELLGREVCLARIDALRGA
jgi:glutamyl-tRNA synthetase